MAQKVLCVDCFERLHPRTTRCPIGAHSVANIPESMCECSVHLRMRTPPPQENRSA